MVRVKGIKYCGRVWLSEGWIRLHGCHTYAAVVRSTAWERKCTFTSVCALRLLPDLSPNSLRISLGNGWDFCGFAIFRLRSYWVAILSHRCFAWETGLPCVGAAGGMRCDCLRYHTLMRLTLPWCLGYKAARPVLPLGTCGT